MVCLRCRGLMISDHCYDLMEESGPLRIVAWRCICCGYIFDPLILQRRDQGETLQWYAM